MLKRQARVYEAPSPIRRSRARWKSFFLALLALAAFTPSRSQDHQIAAPANETPSPETVKRLGFARDRLADLTVSIQLKEKALADLKAKPEAGLSDGAKEKRQQDIQALENDIATLRRSFEEIATGGVDLDYFRKGEEKAFDWRADLEEILQPLFDGLKDLTEKPRTIEKLRSEKADLEGRLEVVKKALENIANIETLSLNPDLADQLAEVGDAWRRHRDVATRDLEIVEYQLAQYLNTGDSFLKSLGNGLSRFFTGRGLNLLLAILVFLLSWSLMGMGLRFIYKRTKGEEGRERNIYFRLFIYSYRLLTVLVSIGLVVVLLYAMGDWILLGLLIIVLIAVALGIKSFIPKFITETKLLLNIGNARENERVIHNGLPWRVRSINVYSWLTNPELRGGHLRLSLAQLSELHSRPPGEGEPWFPSKEGDYLLFSDGSWGQVLLQTPEIVRIQHKGGGITQIPTTTLYESQPQNLSTGTFGVEVIFGIDYQHQSLPPLKVAEAFREGVRKGLRASTFGESVQTVVVEFQQAGASSLDYRIFVTMSSAAATGYQAIHRAIWRLCVQVCNERDWVIPFTQLTLHQGEGFQALQGDASPGKTDEE